MEKNSVNYIIDRLFKMSSDFADMAIRYEFDSVDNYHLIEITPLELFENNTTYLDAEIRLEQEFKSIFPDQNILFISTESLNQITQPILILGTACEIEIVDSTEMELSEWCLQGISEVDNNNYYALAA